METALKFLGKDQGGDYETRLRAKQDEVAASALSAGRTFTQSMAELSQMQQAEILRLQGILRDNTTIPERYPVHVAVHTSADKNGFSQNTLVAVADDRSVWLMQNFKPGAGKYGAKWERVPSLPQVADEVDHAG